MDHTSGIVSILFTAVMVGLVGALIARRRQHLRLVVRVIDHSDHKVVNFLDELVSSGRLAPSPCN